jgi:hypothetical protein
MAGDGDFADFARQVGADPGQPRQLLAGGNQAGEIGAQLFDGAGGVAVGANAERVGLFEIEQVISRNTVAISALCTGIEQN